MLAQVYKRRIRGEDRGGMPYYVKYGLKAPWLAMTLALATMIGYGFVFPGIQANNIASSASLAFGLQPWVTGLVITSLLGLVIIGWMNMVSVLLLTPVVRKVIRDYDRQRKLGIDPVFDPKALEIRGADWWEEPRTAEIPETAPATARSTT